MRGGADRMRNSDRAWLALAGGVAAYDLIATDNERLSDAARRYFKSQPVVTASIILMTGLHLIGGLPHWGDPFALLFATYRRLRLLRSDRTQKPPNATPAATKLVGNLR